MAHIPSMFDMSHAVVAVLGAGAGIGSGCAAVLGAAGAHVVCVDIDGLVAQQTAQKVIEEAGRASAHVVDVQDRLAFGACLVSSPAHSGGSMALST